MSKYIKKIEQIEAFKWTGDITQKEDPEWFIDEVKNNHVCFLNKNSENVLMQIQTVDGVFILSRGDYIIKNTKGEIHSCTEDIFEKMYEKI